MVFILVKRAHTLPSPGLLRGGLLQLRGIGKQTSMCAHDRSLFFSQFKSLVDQTVQRLKAFGSQPQAPPLVSPAEPLASVVGQYSITEANHALSLVERMERAAQSRTTLVVIIADECHWGCGPPSEGKAGSGANHQVGPSYAALPFKLRGQLHHW
jgi:hypothetical protein